MLLGPAIVGEAVKGILESLGEGALAEYLGSEKQIWRVGGEAAGFAKCIEREATFCYVVVKNSGHEAPAYQPKATFDLNSRLIHREFGRWGDGGRVFPQCNEEEGGAGPLLDL